MSSERTSVIKVSDLTSVIESRIKNCLEPVVALLKECDETKEWKWKKGSTYAFFQHDEGVETQGILLARNEPRSLIYNVSVNKFVIDDGDSRFISYHNNLADIVVEMNWTEEKERTEDSGTERLSEKLRGTNPELDREISSFEVEDDC